MHLDEIIFQQCTMKIDSLDELNYEAKDIKLQLKKSKPKLDQKFDFDMYQKELYEEKKELLDVAD